MAGGPLITLSGTVPVAGCPILSTVSSWKGQADMNFAHRPVAPASASGTWDSSTLRLNSCRDSDYRVFPTTAGCRELTSFGAQ
jgi:hypothetical protein